jgi:hypothetical protein
MFIDEIARAIDRAVGWMSMGAREEYTSSIETDQAIIFNSKVDFVLMTLHRQRGLLFGDIRQHSTMLKIRNYAAVTGWTLTRYPKRSMRRANRSTS